MRIYLVYLWVMVELIFIFMGWKLLMSYIVYDLDDTGCGISMDFTFRKNNVNVWNGNDICDGHIKTFV